MGVIGNEVGAIEGNGSTVGLRLGSPLGLALGERDGMDEGVDEGATVGRSEGLVDSYGGEIEGVRVGLMEGNTL